MQQKSAKLQVTSESNRIRIMKPCEMAMRKRWTYSRPKHLGLQIVKNTHTKSNLNQTPKNCEAYLKEKKRVHTWTHGWMNNWMGQRISEAVNTHLKAQQQQPDQPKTHQTRGQKTTKIKYNDSNKKYGVTVSETVTYTNIEHTVTSDSSRCLTCCQPLSCFSTCTILSTVKITRPAVRSVSEHCHLESEAINASFWALQRNKKQTVSSNIFKLHPLLEFTRHVYFPGRSGRNRVFGLKKIQCTCSLL